MIPAHPQAVLFDMDGTILNPINDGLLEFKIRWGIPTDQLIIPNLRHLPEQASDEYNHLAEFEAVNSTLRDGVRELLESLKAANINTALVTNNSGSSMNTVLAKHQVRFDLVLSREDAAMKPAPDMLLLALERLQISASQTVMVGDTHPDVGAARAAKIPVCLLLAEPWNATLEVDEADFRAIRVSGISEVRDHLERTKVLTITL
jgi:phosphoglycolate phosphatase